MKTGTPSTEEQKYVAWYVLERPLVRPKTSCAKALFCVFMFVAANCAVSILLFYLIQWLAAFSFFLEGINRFAIGHPVVLTVILVLLSFSISGAFVIKTAVVGAIRLYQRYAPEEIRRKCLLKPTCSEYAIMAIQKYGLMRGMYKTWFRLFKTCRGDTYRIDDP